MNQTQVRSHPILIGVCIGLVAWLVGLRGLASALDPRPVDPAAPARLVWERVDVPVESEATALALARDGEIVFGGATGLRRIAQGENQVIRSGSVTDLVRADTGVFAATTDSVWQVDEQGRASAEAWGTGGETRAPSRLAAAGGRVAAATPEGVRLRDQAGRWRQVRAVPGRSVSFVALRARGSGEAELWVGYQGELWIAGLDASPASETTFAQRVPLPGMSNGRLLVDARFDCPDADAVVLVADGLLVRDSDGQWQDARPVWPPGAIARRLVCTPQRLVVATDAGLLVAEHARGPWRRAASPLGNLPSLALASGEAGLVAANRRGVWRTAASEPSLGPVLDVAIPTGEPTIAQVERAARAHLGLEAREIQALRVRASRRGFLPEVELHLGYDRDRDRQRDADQAYISGATRDLLDVTRDRGEGWSADVSLSWDLGDAAFDPEEIDAAREARAWISLRDDVLDEVIQLYFERRRALARAAVLAPTDPEQGLLWLRSEELAAGLDAWTGGAFSRLRGPGTPSRTTPNDKE